MLLVGLLSVSLPQGAVGWSAVCDCGIYSLYNFIITKIAIIRTLLWLLNEILPKSTHNVLYAFRLLLIKKKNADLYIQDYFDTFSKIYRFVKDVANNVVYAMRKS